MSRSNPWDVSASGPPVASGQVPFFNPAQFQQDHSTGSAVAPSNTFGDVGHGAGIGDMSASYPFEQGWHNNWNNFGAWPQVQEYNSAGYDGNYCLQQQHSGEPAASLSDGGTYGGELAYDPNWSANQVYEHYPNQFAETGEYNYNPMIVGEYDNLAAGVVDSTNISTSQSAAVYSYASHSSEDNAGMSAFFHQGDMTGLAPSVAPTRMAMGGVEPFSVEQLPAVNSFSNISYQPSPFDELGDMKSPQAGLPGQPVLLSSHSRQSSAGGGVQFLIGGSSNVSESQSRADSPHAPGMEAASDGTEHDQDETKSRTVVTEHAMVTQPHLTDAGSHKTPPGRVDDSPAVHSLLPQGTMTGTPASVHQRKPAAGPGAPLEHPHIPPDFTAPTSSDADAVHMLSCSAKPELVHPEAGISEEFSSPLQPSHQVDDSEMLLKAVADSDHQTDMHAIAGPLGLHPDSSFTPVASALAKNAAISPGQQFISSLSAAVPHMQAGSVCSAAGSDSGALDMREIELDAMVDSGSPQDVRHAEAGSNVEAVGECRVGSGTLKQSLHDASSRGHVHHHVKAQHETSMSPATSWENPEPTVSGTLKQTLHDATGRSHVHNQMKTHREATMSPATTLWENPEPAGVRLLPAPAASTQSRSAADRLLTHELPQNTDAGPSKSGASGIVHEPSLDVHSAMHAADDQRVPQTPVTNSMLLQTSHASSIDHSVPSQVASESSSHAVEYQSAVHPVTGPDTLGMVLNESVRALSAELAGPNISAVNHYSHTLNSGPPKPLNVAVLQTSGKQTSEGVVTVPAGNVAAGKDVIPVHSPQSSDLRLSAGSEVEQTRGMVAHQTPDVRKQNVEHAADHIQHHDDKNSQGNVNVMQNKTMNICQGIPHGKKIESGDTGVPSQKLYVQQKGHPESGDVVKSQQQQVPVSVSDVPDERHGTSRYRSEVDGPRSRQDDMDQVNRTASSRQVYDDRGYGRPRSRQNYDDRGYDRPRSRQGYDSGYEHQNSRQVSEDPYRRPLSRQGYDDPYYYRPRSRQGYDDRRDMPGAGQNYTYPEDGRQQRPAHESRHDRPSSRQSYHEPVDRPRSQQHDYRPRSRQDYEDWYGRGSRDHETAGTRYSDNRYSDADPYKKPEALDEGHSARHSNRHPDESFNRPRHNAPDDRYDRASWSSYQDDQADPRYRPSQGYREDEYRRPRSRGGECI